MTELEHPHSGDPVTGDPHERADPYAQRDGDPRGALEASAIRHAPLVSEEIHMPDPTLIPISNAVAVTLMLLGVTTIRALFVIGLVVFVITTAMWIRDTRREIASLPAEHGHH